MWTVTLYTHGGPPEVLHNCKIKDSRYGMLYFEDAEGKNRYSGDYKITIQDVYTTVDHKKALQSQPDNIPSVLQTTPSKGLDVYKDSK